MAVGRGYLNTIQNISAQVRFLIDKKPDIFNMSWSSNQDIVPLFNHLLLTDKDLANNLGLKL